MVAGVAQSSEHATYAAVIAEIRGKRRTQDHSPWPRALGAFKARPGSLRGGDEVRWLPTGKHFA
jgi:hypothetical protein